MALKARTTMTESERIQHVIKQTKGYGLYVFYTGEVYYNAQRVPGVLWAETDSKHAVAYTSFGKAFSGTNYQVYCKLEAYVAGLETGKKIGAGIPVEEAHILPPC